MEEKKRKKCGTLNQEEKRFIEQYYEIKTVNWLAEELNRTTHQVQAHIDEHIAKEALRLKESTESYNYKYQLRARKYWPELQKQFTADELLLFEDYWTRYIEQFGGDILYTEESQMLDCIKYEILINRNLQEQAAIIKQVDRFQKQIEKEMAFPVIDAERIGKLEEQLMMARTASAARTNEHVKLQNEKNKLFESLKATREKRITKFIDEKINIFQLFKQWSDTKNLQKEAKQSGLYNIAMNKEYDRLTTEYKYDNGEIDFPLLNAEVLESYDAKNNTTGEN